MKSNNMKRGTNNFVIQITPNCSIFPHVLHLISDVPAMPTEPIHWTIALSDGIINCPPTHLVSLFGEIPLWLVPRSHQERTFHWSPAYTSLEARWHWVLPTGSTWLPPWAPWPLWESQLVLDRHAQDRWQPQPGDRWAHRPVGIRMTLRGEWTGRT